MNSWLALSVVPPPQSGMIANAASVVAPPKVTGPESWYAPNAWQLALPCSVMVVEAGK
jgi:hypothetical protein